MVRAAVRAPRSQPICAWRRSAPTPVARSGCPRHSAGSRAYDRRSAGSDGGRLPRLDDAGHGRAARPGVADLASLHGVMAGVDVAVVARARGLRIGLPAFFFDEVDPERRSGRSPRTRPASWAPRSDRGRARWSRGGGDRRCPIRAERWRCTRRTCGDVRSASRRGREGGSRWRRAGRVDGPRASPAADGRSGRGRVRACRPARCSGDAGPTSGCRERRLRRHNCSRDAVYVRPQPRPRPRAHSLRPHAGRAAAGARRPVGGRAAAARRGSRLPRTSPTGIAAAHAP